MCLLVSSCASVGSSDFIVLIFLFILNLVLIALMNTCVKFNFIYFWVATTSVLIIQLSSVEYERKYALMYVQRVPDECTRMSLDRVVMAAILNVSNVNGLIAFLYYSLCLLLCPDIHVL
jgi:hypothetical protein